MHQSVRPPTPEQIDTLYWVASLGAVTAEALALRLDITLASARARLSLARRQGLIAKERPLVEAPALFTLTRAGLRACGAHGIDLCRVSAGGAQHLSVCAMVAAALERCYPDHRLIGERELRRDESDLGCPLASAVLRSARPGGGRSHRPDLVLLPSTVDGLPVAVEVELTIKAPLRLAEICRAWARCPFVAGVLYLAPDRVERALKRAIDRTRACEQIVVVPLEGLLPSEAARRCT